MSYQLPAKLFAPATIARNQNSSSDDYELIVRQRPIAAKVFAGKEKDRKPVDPPPIIQLRVSESVDPSQNYLQSPYFFVSCSLADDNGTRSQAERDKIKHGLAGTLVSSLHRLKDIDNIDGGFFVFGDLSVRVEGAFRLQFTLYEVRDKEVAYIKSVTSEPFYAYAPKNWPGMTESTTLTRSFSDQGVRLRLRKEPRSRLGVRGPASDNYEPRRYKTQNRRQSQADPPQPHQPQQTYNWAHEGGGSQRQAPVGYSARQQHQQLSPPNSAFPVYQRKREYSQLSHSGPHMSHDEEPFSKRARTNPEHAQQHTYGVQQHPLGQEYNGKLYSLPAQASALPYPSSPHQMYSSSFSASPLSIAPRDQQDYPISRRTNAPFPSISAYDSPAGHLSNMQSQRFPSVYDYTTSLQPVSQSLSNLQQPQHQYAPQLSQLMPPIRGSIGMPVYGTHSDPEQNSMLPRPTASISSDMPPPMLGRTTLSGGTAHSGSMVVSSMGEDLRYSRTSMFDTKPRNDSTND